MREQGVVSSQILRQRGEMLLLHSQRVWRGSRPCFRVPGWADIIEPLKAARACHQRLSDDHELLHSGPADGFEKPHMRHHFPNFVLEPQVVHWLLPSGLRAFRVVKRAEPLLRTVTPKGSSTPRSDKAMAVVLE